MKFDENLAAIHGYLCSDGYVIKNPQTQKHKYYNIGLRNTNPTLLKDFQIRFKKYFGVEPHITKEGRCRLGSKRIYELLTRDYSYYCHEWILPNLSISKLKIWLRAFFDAEAWVECKKAKTRSIRIECVHLEGLKSIQKALRKFGIKTNSIKKKKNKNCWVLNICGLDDILLFKKNIGFLHPKKSANLEKAINSYKDYNWKIPNTKKGLIKFISKKGKISLLRAQIRFNSIKRENLNTLKMCLKNYDVLAKIGGPWKSGTGSKYYCLSFKLKDLKNLKQQTL